VLDIKRIRDNPEEVRQALAKKQCDVDFTELLTWEKNRRSIQVELDTLRAKKNDVSKQIPVLKKKGEDTTAILAEMKEVAERTRQLETDFAAVDAKVADFLAALPNLPDPDVAAGGKENNAVVRTFGEKPAFDFKPLDHVELVTKAGLIDYKRGVKLGGNGFWLYKGDGALLEWALLNFFVEQHRADGYELILPPHILTYECGFTAGQFPKFIDDVFHLTQPEGEDKVQFLLPTAETALINFYRDELIEEEELPRKFFSYTPCYRKEAGSYRTNERGMIRGHQFNKVELFQFTRPEDSDAAFEEMVGKAEKLVQMLGLHYQLSKLAAADCSFSMAKTYDIEVWIPSMNEYKEVSSASNARDYQARRGNMRFRRKGGKSTEYMHTLNASGLATSRLLPAIVEQHQQKNGSIVVPQVLRKWVGKDLLK